ncbi:hypothetical protein C21_03965 [Arenibacter sp. NBRC 103722]|nr:hypothetical protein C21_03965 [Arenibacter sp. NBRC 103722]
MVNFITEIVLVVRSIFNFYNTIFYKMKKFPQILFIDLFALSLKVKAQAIGTLIKTASELNISTYCSANDANMNCSSWPIEQSSV